MTFRSSQDRPDEPSPGRAPSWLSTALRRDVVLRSLRMAAVVGTLLVVINYADRALVGELGAADAIKMVLTYLVPYGVATYAAVAALRNRG
ncbi:MAG: nitrate/nitrite transporter NrtS [Myxococcota bacterium]